MRSEGGRGSSFPTHDAMKLRHGWGTRHGAVSRERSGVQWE
jgi:hypothetical protein